MCNNCQYNGVHVSIPPKLAAENEELRKQVSALTQALETQNRENQPYIKELEAAHSNAHNLLVRVQLNGKLPEGLWDDIDKFLSIKTIKP